eukprot:1910703-Rhodomonas_salina.2
MLSDGFGTALVVSDDTSGGSRAHLCSGGAGSSGSGATSPSLSDFSTCAPNAISIAPSVSSCRSWWICPSSLPSTTVRTPVPTAPASAVSWAPIPGEDNLENLFSAVSDFSEFSLNNG